MKDCRGKEILPGALIAYCTRYASSMEQKVTTVVAIKKSKKNGYHLSEVTGKYEYGDYEQEYAVVKNVNFKEPKDYNEFDEKYGYSGRPHVTIATPEYIVVIEA